MSELNLNLARKWRSKTFDTIIGQDLAVRMLKNSLYLGHYFPVYLFSGQRGCGKTTTARVFGSAINCEQLPTFQKSPKEVSVPCESCVSCSAMLAGKHPDFIEIDAASHTGVDNVRQIIESSSFLPLMGRKKIYLIDEAHMLSKAAFNAFLKILEEPPASVIFILATTDPHKIIDTVRSRCFQLFFPPIVQESLYTHLVTICTAEDITYEDKALHLIIKESEGSVRDAINLLEQVRFSAPSVTKQAVLRVLGQLSDEHMLHLFEAVVHKGPVEVLQLLSSVGYEAYAAERIYQAFVELVRAAMWLKHTVPLPTSSYGAELAQLIAKVPLAKLNMMLAVVCEHELAFAKTTKKHLFLEMLLLKLCTGSSEEPSRGSSPKNREQLTSGSITQPTADVHSAAKNEIHTKPTQQHPTWAAYLQQIETLNDPLLGSIFSQARFESYDETTHSITLTFSEQLLFFQDWLADTKAVWQPLLKLVFHQEATIQASFSGKASVIEKIKKEEPMPVIKKEMVSGAPKNNQQQSERSNSFVKYNSYTKQQKPVEKHKVVDVSDAQQWQKAHALLKYFPGTVIEVPEGSNGKV